MIDPRQRGKRARKIQATLTADVQQAIQAAVAETAATDEKNSLIAAARALVEKPAVFDWCKTSANAGRAWPDDAAAVIAAEFIRSAMQNDPLKLSFTEQMGAILVPVLRRAVSNMKLYAGWNVPGRIDGKAETWKNIYLPLAASMLRSIAEVRLDAEIAGPGKETIYPFAWSPQSDSLQYALSYILLGRDSRGLSRNNFLYSRFSRFMMRKGYVGIVPFEVKVCKRCRRRIVTAAAADTCRVCGSEFIGEITPQCLSSAYLQRCIPHHDNGTYYTPPPRDEDRDDDQAQAKEEATDEVSE